MANDTKAELRMEQSRIALPIGAALDRFIKAKQDEFAYATGELSQLLRDIALAGKVVNREINKAGLVDISGSTGMENIQGEDQQKLDNLANIRFIRALTKGGEACVIVSEEDEHINDLKNHGKYVICIDPLDGSSNINVNVSIGTIFSVFRRITEPGTPITREDVLQPGKNQVAAGYLLYGSSTMLVYTTGHGVNGFTYEPSLGEYFLSHPDMKIPEDGSIYSVNEGNYYDFAPEVQEYIDECRKRRYSARYIGSLVSDFHRNLLKGGIYLYPATETMKQGKLRLMVESNALSFVAEQAGGFASSGTGRVLELVPESLHERNPLYIGSKNMVREVENYISGQSK